MSKILAAFLIYSFSSVLSLAGSRPQCGLKNIAFHQEGGPSSRFNIKFQPAFYWSSLGIEAEYVISPKLSLALNVIGKINGLDGSKSGNNNFDNNFLKTGYMAEVIGRYFIQLSKKSIVLPPTGFYVQASAGFSKLMYYDGSTRPFSLNTRFPNNYDEKGNADFTALVPFIGGVGTGYQVELLADKIIANFLVGVQTNIDLKGAFLTFYASPSVGFMF